MEVVNFFEQGQNWPCSKQLGYCLWDHFLSSHFFQWHLRISYESAGDMYVMWGGVHLD
jgi:hypothetical protein